jgi:hypothetical protein
MVARGELVRSWVLETHIARGRSVCTGRIPAFPYGVVGDMHHNLSHSPCDRATHQGPGIILHPASLIDGPHADHTTVWRPRGRPVRLVPTRP